MGTDSIPILLAGGGGGRIQSGRHIKYAESTQRLTNLQLTLLNAMGVDTEAFGDSASWFETINMLIDALRVSVTSDVNLLVKGSRFMRMERVVRALASTGHASGED